MSLIYDLNLLENMLAREVATLERYEDMVGEGHHLTTLCCVNESEMETEMLIKILKKVIRTSDMLFYKENTLVFVMPATNAKQAGYVFDEIQKACKGLRQVGARSYPDDALDVNIYWDKTQRLLGLEGSPLS